MIYKSTKRKKLPAHKVGRLRKFKASEVDDWVRRGEAAQGKAERKNPWTAQSCDLSLNRLETETQKGMKDLEGVLK